MYNSAIKTVCIYMTIIMSYLIYSFIKFSQVINAEGNIFIGAAICLSRFQKYDRYKITILDITSHC